jgi:UDP-N-acetylmuramate dehydrogenase
MSDKVLEKLSGVRKNVALKDYTTYKIGGPAKYFFVAKKKDDLILALKTAKDFKLPVFILGGGSNILVSEKGFKGLVIKMDMRNVEFKGNEALVEAGTDLTKLTYYTADLGLSGLEWAAGIPGTIGGAIYGHAQAFGIKISEAVKNVETINIKTLKKENFSKERCRFSLKNSVFKKQKNLVIISAVLKFRRKDEAEIKKTIKEFLEYRRNGHPINFPSAGSTFVNPVVKVKNKKLLIMFPELNEYNRKGVVPAGYLVAKCGLSGKKTGKAQISEKHANFIVNLGGAKARDVLALMNLTKKKVKKTFGINLETEVQLVGF